MKKKIWFLDSIYLVIACRYTTNNNANDKYLDSDTLTFTNDEKIKRNPLLSVCVCVVEDKCLYSNNNIF